MKIIRTSNYDNESEAQYVVAENLEELEAIRQCRALNDDPKRSDDDWFVVKPDDYRLWRGMEELV